ncbi:glutathione-regulated potassium-efflux system ancillary protein KefG [Vibrio variabilis]|uniref:Glutathione-regulated potassium-efflux system ancillary protein KefG n=1 Tax=Vibrio variabilis TaxID=990271 RepID=A0ABQ0J6G4_9VIBR|nr:glutathione-regulated potassium-efflux system ancillary protein KefG [Vibrio variabilis]
MIYAHPEPQNSIANQVMLKKINPWIMSPCAIYMPCTLISLLTSMLSINCCSSMM